MRIVGVVPNVYQTMEIFSNDVQRPEAIYRPLGLADPTFMSVVVRTRGVPEDFTAQLREAVARVDPNLPLYRVQSMEAALEQAQFIHRGMGVLFAVVSIVGLFLAVVGLYGVMDFSVSTRLREMGVRIAMGATRWNIIRLVFRRVYLQLGLGSALGLALGFALGKPMSAVLIGVESWDAVVSVTVIMILGLTCTVAAILPALKALRVDPVEALRAE
jgi:ABC-type antimicrobial peptide transport system permease subunit